MLNFYRPSREEVEELRNRFPVGARVELDYMSDPYNRTLHTGSQGTVRRVDDMGTVHGTGIAVLALDWLTQTIDFTLCHEEGQPMNDYTHKRYLVRNRMTGETRTVTHKIGSRSYDPPLTKDDEIVSCLGGFRNPNAITENDD